MSTSTRLHLALSFSVAQTRASPKHDHGDALVQSSYDVQRARWDHSRPEGKRTGEVHDATADEGDVERVRTDDRDDDDDDEGDEDDDEDDEDDDDGNDPWQAALLHRALPPRPTYSAMTATPSDALLLADHDATIHVLVPSSPPPPPPTATAPTASSRDASVVAARRRSSASTLASPVAPSLGGAEQNRSSVSLSLVGATVAPTNAAASAGNAASRAASPSSPLPLPTTPTHHGVVRPSTTSTSTPSIASTLRSPAAAAGSGDDRGAGGSHPIIRHHHDNHHNHQQAPQHHYYLPSSGAGGAGAFSPPRTEATLASVSRLDTATAALATSSSSSSSHSRQVDVDGASNAAPRRRLSVATAATATERPAPSPPSPSPTLASPPSTLPSGRAGTTPWTSVAEEARGRGATEDRADRSTSTSPSSSTTTTTTMAAAGASGLGERLSALIGVGSAAGGHDVPHYHQHRHQHQRPQQQQQQQQQRAHGTKGARRGSVGGQGGGAAAEGRHAGTAGDTSAARAGGGDPGPAPSVTRPEVTGVARQQGGGIAEGAGLEDGRGEGDGGLERVDDKLDDPEGPGEGRDVGGAGADEARGDVPASTAAEEESMGLDTRGDGVQASSEAGTSARPPPTSTSPSSLRRVARIQLASDSAVAAMRLVLDGGGGGDDVGADGEGQDDRDDRDGSGATTGRIPRDRASPALSRASGTADAAPASVFIHEDGSRRASPRHRDDGDTAAAAAASAAVVVVLQRGGRLSWLEVLEGERRDAWTVAGALDLDETLIDAETAASSGRGGAPWSGSSTSLAVGGGGDGGAAEWRRVDVQELLDAARREERRRRPPSDTGGAKERSGDGGYAKTARTIKAAATTTTTTTMLGVAPTPGPAGSSPLAQIKEYLRPASPAPSLRAAREGGDGGGGGGGVATRAGSFRVVHRGLQRVAAEGGSGGVGGGVGGGHRHHGVAPGSGATFARVSRSGTPPPTTTTIPSTMSHRTASRTSSPAPLLSRKPLVTNGLRGGAGEGAGGGGGATTTTKSAGQTRPTAASHHAERRTLMLEDGWKWVGLSVLGGGGAKHESARHHHADEATPPQLLPFASASASVPPPQSARSSGGGEATLLCWSEWDSETNPSRRRVAVVRMGGRERPDVAEARAMSVQSLLELDFVGAHGPRRGQKVRSRPSGRADAASSTIDRGSPVRGAKLGGGAANTLEPQNGTVAGSDPLDAPDMVDFDVVDFEGSSELQVALLASQHDSGDAGEDDDDDETRERGYGAASVPLDRAALVTGGDAGAKDLWLLSMRLGGTDVSDARDDEDDGATWFVERFLLPSDVIRQGSVEALFVLPAHASTRMVLLLQPCRLSLLAAHRADAATGQAAAICVVRSTWDLQHGARVDRADGTTSGRRRRPVGNGKGTPRGCSFLVREGTRARLLNVDVGGSAQLEELPQGVWLTTRLSSVVEPEGRRSQLCLCGRDPADGSDLGRRAKPTTTTTTTTTTIETLQESADQDGGFSIDKAADHAVSSSATRKHRVVWSEHGGAAATRVARDALSAVLPLSMEKVVVASRGRLYLRPLSALVGYPSAGGGIGGAVGAASPSDLDFLDADPRPGRVEAGDSRLHGEIVTLRVVQRRMTGNTAAEARLVVAGSRQGEVGFFEPKPPTAPGVDDDKVADKSGALPVLARWCLFNGPLRHAICVGEEDSTLRLHGCVALVAEDSTVAVVLLETLKLLYHIPGRGSRLSLLAVRADEMLLVYADGRARVWDMGSLELRRAIGVEQALALLEDGAGAWSQHALHRPHAVPSSSVGQAELIAAAAGGGASTGGVGSGGVLSAVATSRAQLAATLDADLRRAIEASSRAVGEAASRLAAAAAAAAVATSTANPTPIVGGESAAPGLGRSGMEDFGPGTAVPSSLGKPAAAPGANGNSMYAPSMYAPTLVEKSSPRARRAMGVLRPLLLALLPTTSELGPSAESELADLVELDSSGRRRHVESAISLDVRLGRLCDGAEGAELLIDDARSLEARRRGGSGAASCSSALSTFRTLACVAMLHVLTQVAEWHTPATRLVERIARAFVRTEATHVRACLPLLARYFLDACEEIRRAARGLFGRLLDAAQEHELELLCEEWQPLLPCRRGGVGDARATQALTLLGLVAASRYKQLAPTLLKDVSASIEAHLSADASPVEQALAMELCCRGWSLWQSYLDAMEVVRTLFSLSTMPSTGGGASAAAAAQENRTLARQTTLHIASENTPLFMTTLSLDILHARSPSHCSATMRLVALLVRNRPLVLLPNLPRLAEAVVKSLDPTQTAMREAVVSSATVMISELVRAYPTISFHGRLQRLAVGTHEGAVIVYDLKTATRLYVIEAHRGALAALDFSPDGRRLVTVSVEERCARVWKVGNSLTAFFTPGTLPRQGGGSSWSAALSSSSAPSSAETGGAYRAIDIGVLAERTSDSPPMDAAESLGALTVHWSGDRGAQLRYRGLHVSFDVS